MLGDGRPMLERLLDDPPDFVFNVAEGQGVSRSREARVPAVLEMLGIPHTGSDPLTLAATLDKDCAKRLVESAGLTPAPGCVIEPGADARSVAHRLTYPAIAKPTWEGSSKGIRQRCLVHTPAELPEVVESLQRDQRQPILVEEYIDGLEITVGIVGNGTPEIIGAMSVEPVEPTSHFVYSLEVKRDFRRMVHYECPPKVSARELHAVRQAALTAFRTLGCRALLLEDHIHGVEEAFLILRAFDEHMIARLQSGRLHVIAIFDELCFFRALEIDDACILRLDDDLLILQGAQHSGDTLQILVVFFLFRSLLVLTARHGNARTAGIVAPGAVELRQIVYRENVKEGHFIETGGADIADVQDTQSAPVIRFIGVIAANVEVVINGSARASINTGH